MSLTKTICKSLLAACVLPALLAATGCGPAETTDDPPGGEGPAQAVLILSTDGAVADESTIGGLGVTVVLPDTVSVPLTDGSPDIGVVTASGAAAEEATVLSLFTGASATSPARLSLVVAGGAAGIPVGEFATITLDVQAGHRPVVSDFSLEDFSAVDTYGDRIPKLTADMTLSLQ